MPKRKKEKSKTWSEKATDTLIKCFQSNECRWNVTNGDYKDQKRKSFTLEEFDISVQEYNINRYDYKKNGILSEVNSHYFRKNAPP